MVDTLECGLHDGDGTVIGTVWFFRDVSQRLAAEAAVRESEARYRALVEQSPEAILVFRDMRVLFANRAAAELFGYGADEAAGLVDRPVTDLVSPAVREQVSETFRTSAEAPWNGIQEELQSRDGTLFDAWIISAPVRVEDKPAAQAVIRPLDAGQGVRGRLMQTAKMATLGQMAASVAHELSQPLNILSMGLEGLLLRQAQGRADPRQMIETVEMAVRQCGRMSEIIDHVRVFSRSSKARRVPFEAAGPLRAAAEMMAPVFQREGLLLEVDVPERCGVVEGDPLDLEQVVINLLKNAFDALLEYRAAGGGETGWVPAARVTARPDAAGRYLTLEVSDTGAGIPEDLLPDIFEPFFTTKDEGVGTGLGLAICANTVSRMGGVLRAENRDGAVFVTRLPLAEAVAGAGERAGAGEGEGQGAAAALPALPGAADAVETAATGRRLPGDGGGHVLVAEADAAARRALAVVLVEQGFRVSTAATGDEAAAKARLDPPDVVVAAEALPGAGSDGAGFVHRLRERDAALPVILLSDPSQAGPGSPARRAAGPDVTVLDKPASAAAVVAAVRAVLSVAADP